MQHDFSHDHALGITRLNVYAGLLGFYIVRDSLDSGLEDNPLGLPVGQYEHAYAIQVRKAKPHNLYGKRCKILQRL